MTDIAPSLSIIVPTWNEEKALPGVLARIAVYAPHAEVIIVDGGSADGTAPLVERFARTTTQTVRWIVSERGRGRQMNAGAAQATGDILLFLHADTLLPLDAVECIASAMRTPETLGGNFRIDFIPRSRLSAFYAACYNLRSHLHIFYGDSGLFVRRAIFEEMGGYRADRLMEDVEFIGRLRRRGTLAYIRQATIVTSARRFQGTRKGLKMLFIWTLLHTLMAFGVSQETLERLYPPER